MSQKTVEAMNSVVEFNDIHKFMQDEQVDRALHLIAKSMYEPGEVPPQQVSELIIELQALASKFAILATYYTGIGKDGANEIKKKNMYFTLRDAVQELVNALKYHSRAGH